MPDNPTTPPADGQSGTGPTAIPAARATSNGHVPTLRRFRGDHHCPICGGADDDRRGRGDRCFGFLSGDGAYAHCTRDECAGGIPLTPTSLTYPHRLKGPCRCGKEHGPDDPKPSKAKTQRGGKTTRGRIVATYNYRDADGTLLFQVVRYDPKGFVQRRPSGKGGWLWGLDGVEPVLYRLPELLAADPAQVVLMPEGEKDVDRLRGLGLVATCNPMGAGKWRDSYSASFRGRHVAILADNDRPGRDHAFAVARSVAPWAASVKVVELPGLPEKGDASDFLSRGGTKEDLLALVEAAPPWTPPTGPSAGPSADGRAAAPTPDPSDVAALRKRAGEFQKLSDLTDDVGWLDALARLEVTDPDEANRILTFAQDVLGKKKWAAKPVKIAMVGPRKAARRLASHPPKPRTTLPEILVDRPIHEVIADAVDCLRADPEVFKRGPALVRMIRNENPPKGLQDTEGTPQIAVIPATRLIELLSRSALWVRERTNQDGDPILVATDPTATHASLVKDRCDWPGIRILDRVTEAPCLRPDGTILQVPGYDPETGLFYLPESGVEFPEIPENPTPADARDAAKLLLDLVVDFPFEPSKEEGRESPHKYAWLASLLTMLCRSAIKGPCPLFLFTANTAGSGKTKLNDVNAIIATGRRMPRSSYTENDEEIAKVLFSIALGGFPVVFFDNVGSGGALGGSAFDEALTSTSINGRILGASEMREVPFYAVLFATGNNVRLKGDIHRRIVPCRLESPDEHPEQRDNFKLKEDLEEYTRKHRPAFVAAGLTIVRAYIVAGRPQQHLTPMDYPAWSGLIRNAVSWATGIDPCATREAIDDSDGDANELKRLVVAWEDLCNREKKDAISAADALKAIRPDPATKCSRYDELFDLFTGMSKSGALPTSKVLGKILGKYRGRVVGTETGPKSLREITLHGNVSWFVRPAPGKPTPAKGGSGGSGGSNSGYPVTKTDFSLPRQASEMEEKNGEKKNDFHGHQRGDDPPDPPDPPGIDSDGEDDTVLPCGGCWRIDCPWCTPADDDASEGGAR